MREEPLRIRGGDGTMISEMDKARHAEERGEILKALHSDYSSRMSSVKMLGRVLFMAGQSITPGALQFHLSLLADSGYVKIWRAEEMPGFRPDRGMESRGDVIVFARLMPRGLQLIDGQIPADPGVSF
jgi:hypothetical protein